MTFATAASTGQARPGPVAGPVGDASGGGSSEPGYLVGRLPVVDGALEVVGYRAMVSSGELTAGIAGRADSLDHLRGSAPAVFIRLARPYLLGLEEMPLPPGSLVIEVDGSLAGDGGAIEGLRQRREEGFDVSVHLGEDEMADGELLEMARFVRMDFRGSPEGLAFRLAHEAELGARVVLAGGRGAQVIASGVNDPAQLNDAREAGFDLFEGRILSRPTKAMIHALTPSRVACFQMLRKVEDPHTSATEIERVVQTDPGLSYRLLHVSGLGAAGGLRREVRSIREATVLLGRDWIHKWLLMMVVADANEGTAEQLTMAMIRARMCEVLASAACPSEAPAAFTVGVVSALDVLLGSPLGEVVSKLAITDDLKAALLKREGRLGAILDDVLNWVDWEPGHPAEALRCGLDARFAEGAYLDSLRFAAGVDDALRSVPA